MYDDFAKVASTFFEGSWIFMTGHPEPTTRSMEDELHRRRRLAYIAREHRSPGSYRRRVLGWIALGELAAPAFVLIALATLLVADPTRSPGIVGWAALIVGAPVLLMGVATTLILWFRTSPRLDAVRIRPQHAPELFRELRDLARDMDARMPNVVAVDHDFNAYAAQRRRWFAPWTFRSYLVVGLPLMAALPPDEFRGVLAHELAHLRRGDGRLGSRAWGALQGWDRAADELAANSNIAHAPFEWFAAWYVPRLSAMTFACRRRAELEADAIARERIGGDTYADALARIAAAAPTYIELMQAVFRRAATELEPPADWLASAMRALGQGRSSWNDTRRIRAAIREDARDADDMVHPPLGDRLAASSGSDFPSRIGECGTRISHGVGEAAATSWIDDAHEAGLVSRVEQRWAKGLEDDWRWHRALYQDAERRRSTCEGRIERTGPNIAVLYELAELAGQLDGPDARLDALRRATEHDPDAGHVSFALGELLLEAGDIEGVAVLHRAMAQLPSCREAAAALISDATGTSDVGDDVPARA